MQSAVDLLRDGAESRRLLLPLLLSVDGLLELLQRRGLLGLQLLTAIVSACMRLRGDSGSGCVRCQNATPTGLCAGLQAWRHMRTAAQRG